MAFGSMRYRTDTVNALIICGMVPATVVSTDWH